MSKKKNVKKNRRYQSKGNGGPRRQAKKVIEKIEYTEGITVKELAEKIEQTPADIIKILFMMGVMVTINSPLDDETVELVCLEYDVEAEKVEEVDEFTLEDDIVDPEESLEERPAIITIMGHVDHGKTSTLDAIRQTNVVGGEHGGITQHIGAYQIKYNDKKLTFLDTPGHEAFTAMRARGAQVTDIVVIVVAADDGVMPQTKEAIDHAKAAEVPIIVAVNKIDKGDANIERIYSEFADMNIIPEEWGGDTVFVKISAKTGQGIDELIETLIVASELLELKANPDRIAVGTVIEAKLDKGRGPVATLLVQKGTLHQGDTLVVGSTFGRVRKMVDHTGRELEEAGPSMPVEIIGLSEVPVAGDLFKVFENEKDARQLAEKRQEVRIETERSQSSALSLDDLSRQIADGDIQDVNVVLKADVQGSAEAMKASLERLDVRDGEVRVNVIRAGVGGISENDIMLASASNAIIIGFNVRPTMAVRKMAEEEGVDIRLYNVIYKALEAMEKAMKGLLEPEYEEIIYGQAEVRELYKVSRIGTIAGCMVVDGKMVRDSSVRLIRDGVVIYEGKMGSLKRFKDDAREVAQGYECGITIENFNDIKEGDVIESHGEVEIEIE